MINIVQKDDPVLRQIAKAVPKSMFGGPELARIIRDMKDAIASQEDAVAIAAPQIGVSLRIFVVSGKVFDLLGKGEGGADIESDPADEKQSDDIVFINPEIVKLSKERKQMEEGCLSVRYLYGKTSRATKAKVRAYDEKGKAFEIGGSGLLAQIFQHEIDHLEGTLFIDTATEVEDLPPDADDAEKTAKKPKKKARIAFFGTPDFAVWVLEGLKKGGVIPDLIVAAPDAPKGRKLVMTPPPAKVWANDNDIPVIQPAKIKTPEFETELRGLAGKGGWDLFIVAAYGKIIPENILYMPKRKTINVHPSLLPLLRGSSPLQTAILEDMRDTGVTIMRLDREMDHGPILAQKKADLPLWPVDAETLGKALAHDGAKLIGDILPALLDGSFKETEQDHSKATYTEKIAKEDGEIDLAADPYKNFLKFKAYKGWPGSYFFADRKGAKIRVTITDAAFENGAFTVKKVIPEGKKEMDFTSFLSSTASL
ncbi:peptide deformylase [Candidatus Parcubacteria bacterium]|nr:peptide deformylase [Candidatus Parcubacteria bacterium]